MATLKSSIIETTDVNQILFPVELVDFQDFAANSDYSMQVIGYPLTEKSIVKPDGTIEVIREPQKTLLNSCSDRYNLVTNQEIFIPILNALNDKNLRFDQNYKSINNARFYANYSFNDNGVQIGNDGDYIFPKLSVNHSYNGLTKYSINFGYFRLICSNGLTVPVSEMKQFNLNFSGKHTEKLSGRINELIERVIFFSEHGKMITEPFNLLNDRMIANPADRITEVLKANNILLVENSNFNTLNFINEVIAKETDYLKRSNDVTDWYIYNGINQYLFKNERNNNVPEVNDKKDNEVLNWLIANPA